MIEEFSLWDDTEEYKEMDRLLDVDIEKFKNREAKAKDVFYIEEIDKPEAYEFVRKYHYLGDAKFFAMYCYGLFNKTTHSLLGVATYSLPQGTESLKGWFGLDNDTKDIMELSRLCMLPSLNGTNATSYLLGNSMKKLKDYKIRAVITLATSDRHAGSIYQVCNFKYYGLTEPAKDFYEYPSGAKNKRGTITDKQGVWVPRTRKHRYAYVLDPTLKVLYDEQPRPTKGTYEYKCCDGGVVYDNRYGVWYTCPVCSGKFEIVRRDN